MRVVNDQQTSLCHDSYFAQVVFKGCGLIQLRSTFTAIDRCRSVTETTNSSSPALDRITPSAPASGPQSSSTVCPTKGKRCRVAVKPDLTIESTAAISRESTGCGILPQLTMCTTPGTVRIGNRLAASKQ